jgi:pilus assembly protein CpaE
VSAAPGTHRTIVVGASGGGGASLLASGLALCWARAGLPAWLIELDIERGDLGGAWDTPSVRTLADLAAVVDELDGSQLRRAAHAHASGVRLLLAPPALHRDGAWAPAAAARLVQAAGEAAGSEGRVVVDAGAGWLLAVHLATDLRASVLLVCRPTLSAARRARRLLAALAPSGADARCALVVSTGPDRGELSARAVGRAAGASVVAELPWAAREAAELGAGRWPRGRRARLAGAVERVAGALG